MKKRVIGFVSAIIFLAITTGQVEAQSNFEQDFTTLHKMAIKTCGMIKKPQMHQKADMLKGLEGLRSYVLKLKQNYAENPPQEYAEDPLWKSYFFEFGDIIDALQTRVEKQNYKAAALNCSRFCMLFDKIHTINGHLSITDIMFRWYSQITMTSNMLNAANYDDAATNLEKVKMLHKNVLELKKKTKGSVEFNNAFEQINGLYKTWLKDIDNRDYAKALETYKKFKGAFGKAFLLSLG